MPNVAVYRVALWTNLGETKVTNSDYGLVIEN